MLDEHDDQVTDHSYHLQQLFSPDLCDSKAEPDPRRHWYKHMARIEQNLREVADAIEAMETTPATDCCLMQQHDEQVNCIKMELIDISHQIASIDEDTSDLEHLEKRISKTIFRTSLQARRQLQYLPPVIRKDGIKLPKLDIPTFDGNVINWCFFGNSIKYRYILSPSLQIPRS